MDFRRKIEVALKLTLILGTWAIICLMTNDNLSYVKKTMREGIEKVNPHGNHSFLVRKE